MNNKENNEFSFSEKGFLFDSKTGFTYTLNKTASFIFSRLQKKISLQDILKELIVEFDINPKQAEEDFRDFMQMLKDFELI